MKISIDVDNVLTKHTQLFLTLAQIFKSWGCEVGILSGRAPEHIPQGPWDFVIGCPMGAPYTNEREKSKLWKAKMIRDHKIDIHFDDMADWILEGDVGNAKVIKVL